MASARQHRAEHLRTTVQISDSAKYRDYQSRIYSVPSRPVPSAFVKTSNTFCPPHESESGSYLLFDRIPHSFAVRHRVNGNRAQEPHFLATLRFDPLQDLRVSRSGG